MPLFLFVLFKVGDKITLADITVASALVYPMKLVMSPEYRKAFPCVTRWFTTCVAQPQFKAVVGTVELAKEELTAAGAPAVPKKEVSSWCWDYIARLLDALGGTCSDGIVNPIDES